MSGPHYYPSQEHIRREMAVRVQKRQSQRQQMAMAERRKSRQREVEMDRSVWNSSVKWFKDPRPPTDPDLTVDEGL